MAKPSFFPSQAKGALIGLETFRIRLFFESFGIVAMLAYSIMCAFFFLRAALYSW